LFAPTIPELLEIRATEQEIRGNLQAKGFIDLLEGYEHRTECYSCTRTAHSQCPFILREYEIFRDHEGIWVTSELVNSCKAQPDPYKVARSAELMQEFKAPWELRDKTVQDYKAGNSSQIKAKAACVDFVKELPDRLVGGEGLIFIGPTGTGKTHLAIGTAKGIINQYQRLVRFVDVGTWASDFVYGSRSFEEKKKSIEQMKRADILVLDDLGQEMELSSKGTVIGAIQLILKHRTNEAKSTIITSNINETTLAEHLGQRIWSRVRNRSDVVIMTGADHREYKATGWEDLGRVKEG